MHVVDVGMVATELPRPRVDVELRQEHGNPDSVSGTQL
jgi:hypothetical protein